ncbi:MAG: chromate transporter [Clostridiaceae bacterium]|jgi:chromate transporter|nr:chromate transporter [Clostridiaceae bacterium]
MILLKLFWSFFLVGLFSFGGGYAALPLIQEQVIEINSWLTPTEFMDILTISQMTPGPIAINASTFVGTKIAGIPGAIAATTGCVTPSCIIVLILAALYYRFKGLSLVQGVIKGLRPAVVALIAASGVSILLTALFGTGDFTFHPADLDIAALVLFAASLFALRKFKPDPILVMLGAGIIGTVIYTLIIPL